MSISATRVGSSSSCEPPFQEDLEAGFRIGDYYIERFIASGGFGSVYKARDSVRGRMAAIKVLHPELRSLGHPFLRFLREARLLKLIEHPNVVEVYDSGVLPDGRAYICTELLVGLDLERHIEAQGRLSLTDTVAILEPICDALDGAHAQNIIHRDIKASNVYLDESDDRRRVVLLDFGLAKVIEVGGVELTSSRMALGTPTSMSPEQQRGESVDARTDVYGLGVLAYHMLTGALPFSDSSRPALQYMHMHGSRPRASQKVNVDLGVDQAIVRAMCSDPDGRQSSCREFLDELKETLSQPLALSSAVEHEGLALLIDFGLNGRIDELDDGELEHIDSVLEEAASGCAKLGFDVMLESGESMLFARPLSGSLDEANAERRQATRLAVFLSEIATRAGSTLSANVCLQKGPVVLQGGRLDGGALLYVESWAPSEPMAQVVGSGLLSEDGDAGVGTSIAPSAADSAPDDDNRSSRERSLAEVGSHVSCIVHDMRSPLAAMVGNVGHVLEAMRSPRKLDDDDEQALEDALEAAQHLKSAIEAILAGPSRPSYCEQRAHSVSDLVESAVQLTDSELRRRASIEIIHKDDSWVVGSKVQLINVVVNLLVNALHSFEDGGHAARVVIRTSRTQTDHVEISVRDTGAGMSLAVQERVFEPFFSTKDSATGTGLGLSIVRDIVENHGGYVSVDSAVGVGSCVRIGLPAVESRLGSI